MNITFTLDLEDHRPQPNPAPRYPAITRAILDFLSEREVRGTFFVLGEVAEQEPDLIRDIHQRGHEIGFHTYAHVPLTRENPERFREQTKRSKALLEALTGAEVIGFRAPSFSLTPETTWVLPILAELGFRYTSSVVPVAHPLYGFRGAPQEPFRWNDALLEIPVPVARFGPVTLPFLGGIYMRYLPDFALLGLAQRSRNPCLWTYCHPYDFDAKEKFAVMRETSGWVSFLLWLNRRNTYKTLDKIIDHGIGLPFRDRIANGEYNTAPAFNPASRAA